MSLSKKLKCDLIQKNDNNFGLNTICMNVYIFIQSISNLDLTQNYNRVSIFCFKKVSYAKI